jgi:hypothetical protein
MNKFINAIAILLASSCIAFAQDTSLWKKGGVASLNFSQSSFTNWAAGGENNVTITGLLSTYGNRKTATTSWENSLDLGYGNQKIGGGGARKSEDRIEFNSKYGYKIADKFYASALLNFRSQFTEGFQYTDTSTVYVSNFMAPSFTQFSLGIDYQPVAGLSIFVSPLTNKITTVLDDSLSKQGVYGVDSGDRVRFEYGALAAVKYQKSFKNNILFKSKIDMFMNYEDPAVIDVNWENVLSFQFSKYITFSITTNLLYDQDILIAKEVETSPGVKVVENKARTQFKQVLAIGATYKF